jgi:hypothetical protein
MGSVAYYFGAMTVSPSGRFSDCRNWTDFMFEEASGLTMVVDDAAGTRELSQRHMTLVGAAESLLSPHFTSENSFMYVNYAEGGACGDTPFTKAFALGTFKDQVDTFEANCKGIPGFLKQNYPLGNILFIIWFGANDLYTADRPAEEMGVVANQIANTQRNRLAAIADIYGISATFIFVDLARPLTSVRYAVLLEKAKYNLKTAPEESWTVKGGVGVGGGVLVRTFPRVAAQRALERQMKEIKNLETGVLNFNAKLRECTQQNGDHLVQIGKRITEESVRKLVSGNYRLKQGAAPQASPHVSAIQYDLLRQKKGFFAHMTTMDEAHPSDEMYRLIWHEIRDVIWKARCTFGKLALQAPKNTLLRQLAKVPSVGGQSAEEEIAII